MNAMTPTRARTLLCLALVAGAFGWGLVRIIDGWAGRVLPVPWLAAAAIWLLAAATAYWAFASRPRLQRRPGYKPLPPLIAARTAALAMAASRGGALVAGFYAGVAIAMVGSMSVPSGAATFWSATFAALGSVLLIAAALWLEHMCRLPVGPDDKFGGEGTG